MVSEIHKINTKNQTAHCHDMVHIYLSQCNSFEEIYSNALIVKLKCKNEMTDWQGHISIPSSYMHAFGVEGDNTKSVKKLQLQNCNL